jgi:RNA polymerase sigma factor (TIGR02999 family)
VHTVDKSQPELNDVFVLVYEELRRIAHRIRKSSGPTTLNTTALVHEAWLKLRKSPSLKFNSDAHLKAIAAAAMRQILRDSARRRRAGKRGGAGEAIVTELDNLPGVKMVSNEDVLALEIALEKLAAMDARKAKVVECRFYGSMTTVEIAHVIGVSNTTIEGDWRAAKAWLSVELDSWKNTEQQ